MINDPITKVMQDASEIVRYDEVGIPLYIREGLLSSYPDHRALCHWHEDIEWVQIRSGQMNYYINGKRVLLNAGEAIIVNSRQMLYSASLSRFCENVNKRLDIPKTARNVTLSVSCAIRKSSPRTAFCTSLILRRFFRIRLWNIFI